MLHLHRSNHLERLADRLAELVAVPLPDPFMPETVVVQHLGMARWLEQRLALRLHLAANLDFPLPARFFWQMFACWLPEPASEADGFRREVLVWRLYDALPALLTGPGFEEPARYLAGGGADDGRLYQLCDRVADLFDQYLVYRPEMILDWDTGREEHWQARLWRAVTAGSATPHRAALWQRFRTSLRQGSLPLVAPPPRAFLFALSALPPSSLDLLAGLARHLEIHLFLCTPCREYWADLVPEREQARRAGRTRTPAEEAMSALLDVGNPLLASMGHAGKDFQDLLLDLAPLEEDDFDAPPEDGLLLHEIQRDILDLRDRRVADAAARDLLLPEDMSLQVHACHSPLREVQVLHDRLLRLFETLPGLAPREVVVMAPEMERYAPWIEAVFGTAADEVLIPWSIADRRPATVRPLLAACGDLLRLPVSRLEASSLLDLLELPALRRRFGLAEEDLPRLHLWVQQSGIRWGADAADRAALDLPPVEENSWEFGLARLFLGYALPPEQELFQQIAPCHEVEGSGAEALGALQEFFDAVRRWRRRLAQPLPAAAWPACLAELVGDFFLAATDDEEAQQQELRDTIQGLAEDCAVAGCVSPLPLTLVVDWLEGALAGQAVSKSYLGGQVTCCNMVPMRSLPFRVICLLGMNDTDFPRVQRPPGFDLMAGSPRRGDRCRRRDDRYLFLESLVSARDVLYCSYVGRDIRDDSAREPSVLLSELLDYVRSSTRLADAARDPVAEQILLLHPLQAFSPRYFTGSASRLFSYSRAWSAAAAALRDDTAAVFADGVFTPQGEEPHEVSLEDLLRFFADPAAEFLSTALGVREPRADEPLEDSESFALAGLEGYSLRQDVLTRMQRSGALPHERLEAASECLALARARGQLPHGAAGEFLFRQQAGRVEDLAARLASYPADDGLSLALELQIADVHLSGILSSRAVAGGLLGTRPGGMRPRDRLAAWIVHLACSVLQPDTSRHWEGEADAKGKGGTFTLGSLATAEAIEILTDLLSLRQEGLRRPLPLLPASAYALVTARQDGLTAAHRAWAGNERQPGEGAAFAATIVWQGQDPVSLPEFAVLARRVWAPVLHAAGITPPESGP
ncbi:MAG: exodeoxyribonuclease V subunit gamma [Desulfobulbaceae bacterium A2]|nr:MAG: exodeoxyribonuclease V subunit gamma [Desulfobulbaceae bacterium A2]